MPMQSFRALLAGLLSVFLFATAFAQSEAVDPNTADAATLARVLNGVGMVTAEAIVTYREVNGPFTRVEDLMLVRGIGPALLERNRAAIVLGSDEEAGQTAARQPRGREDG